MSILARFRLGTDHAWFVDIDGTLAPFRDDPGAVRVPREHTRILGSLARACGGALALVSGRSLESIDRIVAPLRLPAAAEHGAVRRNASGDVSRQAISTSDLLPVRERIESFCQAHPGAFLEVKGTGVALHYRAVPDVRADATELMAMIAAELASDWMLLEGKMVLELKSRRITKASAIATFLKERPFAERTPAFFGDDATDEDGFAFVNARGGVTVKVGPGETVARARLDSIEDVWNCFEEVIRGNPS